MRVKDVMTKRAISVRPGASLKEVAEILARGGISGLPVVDEEGRVLGVVSEADILQKERGRGAERRGVLAWLSEWEGAEAEAKLRARTAGEAMTQPAVTIEGERPIWAATAAMIDHGVNRLPVVDAEGRLVGIVTRADLVRAFARPDAEIAREIREDVVGRTLWIPPENVEVTVESGVVTLRGEVQTRSEAELLPPFVERVPGVVTVGSEVTWKEDDLKRRRTG